MAELSILKGVAFVGFTALILFISLRRAFAYRFQLESQLRAQIDQVQDSKKALTESEQRFRKAVEDGPVPMIIFAEDGEILSVSQTWLDITGYTADQLRTIDEWTTLAYGERKQSIRAGIDNLFDLTGRMDEGEFTIRCRDGSYRVWRFSSTPLSSLPDGRRVVLSIAADMTDQHEAETFRLENERLKAHFQKEQERNTFVEKIVSSLSHDLRTLLTTILTSTETLGLYADRLTPEKRQNRLDVISQHVKLSLEMLTDTVSLAQGTLTEGSFRPAYLNLAALCQVSVEEIQQAHKSTHRLVFHNAGKVEMAYVDEVLISRVLLNLLTNAVKYSPDGGEVRLELNKREAWIVLRVIDQGIGIPAADLPRIFEPFFRSRAVGRIPGTGLGLSIVKDCVERHHGRISVESVLGRGTTFTVELPLAGDQTPNVG